VAVLGALAAGLLLAPPAAARTARHLHARLYLFFDQEKLSNALFNGGRYLREAEGWPKRIRGAPFTATVTLANCRAGAEGRCNVTVDYALLGPDGATVKSSTDCPLWSRSPRKGAVVLSDTPIRVMFEANDPAGAYVMRATVRDNVAQAAVTLERRFTLE